MSTKRPASVAALLADIRAGKRSKIGFRRSSVAAPGGGSSFRQFKRYVEQKEITFQVGSTGASLAGNVIDLLGQIGAGGDIDNREGRHIRMKYVDLILAAFNTTSQECFQVSIVLDRQPNGAAPNYNQIFDTSVMNAGLCMNDTASNRKRFKVLWVQNYSFSPNGTNSIHIRKRVPVPDIYQDVEYQSSATGTPNSNAVYLCYGTTIDNTNTQLWFDAKSIFEDY